MKRYESDVEKYREKVEGRRLKEARTMFKRGEKVMLSDIALDNYGYKYEGKVFVITNVATSTEEHPGYDNSMEGSGLYDLRGFDFSVYDYELEKI